MMEWPDPAVVGLVGSRTRALTLGVLANSNNPLTGYRIADVAGLQPIKVYAELRKLKRLHLVSEMKKRNGVRNWVLADPDVRELFRRRLRISWIEDWEDARNHREATHRRQLEHLRGQGPLSVQGRARTSGSQQHEERNRMYKDRLLIGMGLHPSLRYYS